jgi:oligoendopeptidase F
MATDTLEALPRTYPRSFVPADLRVRGFDDVQPMFEQLLAADVSTPEALESWLKDWSELTDILWEVGSRVHIRSTVDTTNAEYKQAFLDWVEKFEPRVKPITEKLNRKFRDAPGRAGLDPDFYRIFERSVITQLDLYREENIPLQTELSKLTNQYDEIQGGIAVQFEGAERTPQQMAKFQLEPDRGLRERAFWAMAERRLQVADKLHEIYDKQVRLREQVARNAGCKDFREYSFRSMERFEYTPEHCHAFADAVERVVLPAVKRLRDKRRRDMGLKALRPWDLSCDPKGRPPLKPFEQVEKLKEGCHAIFNRVDGELGAQFGQMRELGLLDLENRKGKAPGGYQATLAEARLPFIFMNAVGVDGDVSTLLHEGGHAFHTFAVRDMPFTWYRGAPTEFCEVASMSMELLGAEHLGEFYSEADVRRARREAFQDILNLLPWMATIDQFQHWVYTHEGHSVDERVAAWLEIFRRYRDDTDWSGLEDSERAYWQRQGHLFWLPFYYIEYAIAQIGALQVWLNSKRDRKAALAQYRHALSLGGSRTLPELFSAAGCRFAFDAETLKPLVEAVEAELETIGD